MTSDQSLALECEKRAINLCHRDDDLYPTLQSFMSRLENTVQS